MVSLVGFGPRHRVRNFRALNPCSFGREILMDKFLPAEGSTFEDEEGNIVTLTDRPRFVDVNNPYYSAFAMDARGLECEVQWKCLPEWLSQQHDGQVIRNEKEACDWEDFFVVPSSLFLEDTN